MAHGQNVRDQFEVDSRSDVRIDSDGFRRGAVSGITQEREAYLDDHSTSSSRA